MDDKNNILKSTKRGKQSSFNKLNNRKGQMEPGSEIAGHEHSSDATLSSADNADHMPVYKNTSEVGINTMNNTLAKPSFDDFLGQYRYNVRDTKRFYSEITDKVLKGNEIITVNGSKGSSQVSHIKTDLLDKLLEKFALFHPEFEQDEELGIWTVSVIEIDMYGEGSTKEEAIEDLLKSIIEYAEVYLQKMEVYSMVSGVEKFAYMRRILRCGSDHEKLRKVLGI